MESGFYPNFRNHQFTAMLEKFSSRVSIEPWQVREGTCAFVLSVVSTKLVTRRCPTPWIVEPCESQASIHQKCVPHLAPATSMASGAVLPWCSSEKISGFEKSRRGLMVC